MNSKKLTRLGLLTAVSLIIFIIELRIPNIAPVPGIKLGLANIVTVYAVYNYSPKESALVLFSRILLGSFFCGNLLALLYSAAGGVLCLVGMIPLSKVIDQSHIWVCSVFGAALHNIGQIIVAMTVMRTPALISYLPFLLVSGCIAGTFTGVCAQILIKRLRKKS